MIKNQTPAFIFTLIASLFFLGCTVQNVNLTGFDFSKSPQKTVIISDASSLIEIQEMSELKINLSFDPAPAPGSQLSVDLGELNAHLESPLASKTYSVPLTESNSTFLFKVHLGRAPPSGDQIFVVKFKVESDSQPSEEINSSVKIKSSPFSIDNIKVNGAAAGSGAHQALGNSFSVSADCSKLGLEIKIKKDEGDISTNPEINPGSSDLVNGRCELLSFNLRDLDLTLMPEGQISLYLEAKDNQGFVARSNFFSVVIDRSAPIAARFVLDGYYDSSSGAYFSKSSNQSPAVIRIKVPAGTEYSEALLPANDFDPGGNTWSELTKTVYLSTSSTTAGAFANKVINSFSEAQLLNPADFSAPLSEGNYYVILKLADRSGNTSEAASKFIVDTTAPTINFRLFTKVNSKTNWGPLVWSDAGGDILTYDIQLGTSLGGSQLATWTPISPTGTAAERRYTVKAGMAPFALLAPLGVGESFYWSLRVRDKAGNELQQDAPSPMTLGMYQTAYVKSFNSGANDSFGYSVAVSGDYMVVGAPYEDSGYSVVCNLLDFPNLPALRTACDNNTISAAGAAYVYKRDVSGDWELKTYLKSPAPGINEAFGYDVAIDGSRIAVSAAADLGNGTGVQNDPTTFTKGSVPTGAVFIFEESADRWQLKSYIKPQTGQALGDDRFGESIDLMNDYLVVGQPQINLAIGLAGVPGSVAGKKGRVEVFRRISGNWGYLDSLVHPAGDDGDGFGMSVGISVDTSIKIIVGSPYDDSAGDGSNVVKTTFSNDSGALNSGAAFVYNKPLASGSFTLSGVIKPKGTLPDDRAGTSVDINENWIAVGAPGDDSNELGVKTTAPLARSSRERSGAVYLVNVVDGGGGNLTLTFKNYIKGLHEYTADTLGSKLKLSGNSLLLGMANMDDIENHIASGTDYLQLTSPTCSVCETGAAIYFSLNPASGAEQKYLIRAGNNGIFSGNSLFGQDVDISSSGLIVVGAPGEKSSGTSIYNSEASDPISSATSPSSGAVYLYQAP